MTDKFSTRYLNPEIATEQELQDYIAKKKTYRTTATFSNSTLTYTSVTGLVTTSLAIGTYAFRFFGIVQSANTTSGIGIRISPVSATMSGCFAKWLISSSTDGTAKNYQYDQITFNQNTTSSSPVGANINFTATGDGSFTLSQAGTVSIQLRPENDAVAASMLAGSYLIIEQL